MCRDLSPNLKAASLQNPGTESPGGALNSSQLTSDMKCCHLLVFTSLLSVRSDTDVVGLMGPKQAACCVSVEKQNFTLTQHGRLTNQTLQREHVCISFICECSEPESAMDRIQSFTPS